MDVASGDGASQPTYLSMRFGLVQICYWFANCAAMGFAVVYLLQFGFSYTTTGLVVAGANLLSCGLQPLLGNWADKTERFSLRQIICGISVLGFALSVLLAFNKASEAVLVLFFLVVVLVVTVQPLVNALGLAWERVNFGLARGLGSVAYAVAAAVVGMMMAGIGAALVDDALIVCWIALFATTLLLPAPMPSASSVSEKDATVAAEAARLECTADVHGESVPHVPCKRLHRENRSFCLVVIAAFLLMVGYTGLNLFVFSNVQAVGGDSGDMGVVVAVASAVELPFMALYAVLRKRFSCQAVLAFSAAAFLVKIIAVWLAPSVELLFAAQCLQGLSYALYVPAIVEFAKVSLGPAEAVKGQAIVTTVFTAALVVAGLAGGALLDVVNLDAAMLLWTVVTAMGALVVGSVFLAGKAKAAARVR